MRFTLLPVPGNALARFLLDRVRQKLATHQRHKLPGFTLKKSTVDRILALRVPTVRLRDFRTVLLAADVDLRKSFYSVNRDALLRILALLEISRKLVNLIFGLYSGKEGGVV